MTPSEFKSWFQGYTEAMSGVPTKKQWARIQERVAEIDGKPVTERVFIDRYSPPCYPYWYYQSLPALQPTYTTKPLFTTSGTAGTAGGTYCSNTSMFALGKLEALES